MGRDKRDDDIPLQDEWPGEMLSSKAGLMGGSAVARVTPPRREVPGLALLFTMKPLSAKDCTEPS